MTGFEELRLLCVGYHVDNCSDSTCNCDRESAESAWALYRKILRENQEES